MPQLSWAETAGQAKPIRGPRFGIGIQRHPHDIHDHTTSVNCRWKRQDLQEVRETREVQSFVAAQAAHKRDARSERVVGLHATNLEASAEANGNASRWDEPCRFARGSCAWMNHSARSMTKRASECVDCLRKFRNRPERRRCT